MLNYEFNGDRLTPVENAERAYVPAETVAERIAAEGAIMTVPGCPVARFLVGHFAWLEPGRVFWFTAYGDSQTDGHVLDFDVAHTIAPGGVCFAKEGAIVGQLTLIDEAGVDDPDDYRIAWQLWQEVAPLRVGMIEACGTTLAGDAWRSPGSRAPFSSVTLIPPEKPLRS